MTEWLIVIILVLILLLCIQANNKRNRSKQLQYMTAKLSSILTNKSSERVLLLTSDKELQEHLNAINLLLDDNQQTQAHYHRTEQSMRRMLSNISHDLKTPLTVVLGYTETLLHQRNISPEELERLLRKVHLKAEEIVQLMNAFFDLSKLESGDTELAMASLNMNEICKNNMLMFYESLLSHGCEAQIDIPDAPIHVYSNEEALNRILNNLLANAIQHGRDGKIIGLSLRSEEQFVWIDVWDQGRGISERHQDLIFERMYTLEDSRNKTFQGSGLGLTITKRLVQKLGGDITLHSIPYEKTTFTLKLPRSASPHR